MLHFFLWYPLSAFGFGTALSGFADEVALAAPIIMYVLVVPSIVWSRVGSGGFLGEALLLRGFHDLRGIFARGGFRSGGLVLGLLMGVWSRVGVVFIG